MTSRVGPSVVRAMSKATLPAIRAPIGHIPQRLKDGSTPPLRNRIEVLRKIVTRLVREERVELSHNRAEEVRPYMERLLQLAVLRGSQDEYTARMLDWWLLEPDLIYKMHRVLAPRFTAIPQGPFTSLHQLSPRRMLSYEGSHPVEAVRRRYYRLYNIAILEIDGNPYPAVDAVQRAHAAQSAAQRDEPDNVANLLLENALRSRLREQQRN